MRCFRDPAQAIHVGVEETFAIELEGNPTTGYTWHARLPQRCLDLVEHEFSVAGRKAGAAGMEIFRFRAREVGQTEVMFAYRRPWGGTVREMRRFQVEVR